MNWYRIKTAFIGLKRLATLPDEDKQAWTDAEKAKIADLNRRIVAEKPHTQSV
jgi:hypothetical protein